MKIYFKISTLIFFLTYHLTSAQQIKSPLEASFDDYQHLKEDSHFHLDWVSLGPMLNSARADVVQLDARHPGTMYVGFGSGGLWKTIDHGVTWHCVFENQASMGIGDMELAPSDPSIIYVGTGENLKKPRNFTLPGTGMYRSGDAGKTWTQIGLEDSWSIGEIAIDPKNPDIVMVAVLGHLWSKNKNRGLYKTINGGKTWQQVLYKDESTGANDIVIAPANPKIMYASMWEVYPGVSGKNSGVYRSKNGGKTWTPCVDGLPSGALVGRIGLTVSHTNPLKAYAFVDNLNNPEGQTAELYKTIDGGVTWSKTNTQPFFIFSVIGWYFTDVYVNPKNDEEVYCLGIRLAHSIDGGKTFSFIGGQVNRVMPSAAKGFHLDQSELWINPENPNHIAAGNDGGFYESFDKGLSWIHYNNIPVGEFYDIEIDHKNYTIYGGTQDDATVYGPAKELNIHHPDRWKYLWIDPWDGGDGCVSAIDPDDDNTVYYSAQHGDARRYDKKADTATNIKPELPKVIKDTLTFNYITPYFVSNYDSKTLYHGGNYIFKSNDRGDSWKVISPNLARSSNADKKSFSMGALAESLIEKGLLYAGTDHGALWVTHNEGESWTEIDNGIADNYIRSICPSRFSKSRVYLAMTGINYDDLHSYVYVSEDYGNNWISITRGLPDEPVNVILEDPTYENILYAGSIRGVYISTDRGRTWSYLGKHMSGTAIADLEIHTPTKELIAATHGRGIYKLNLEPIYTLMADNLSINQDHLFELKPITLPWFHSVSGVADYRTVEKTSISFWMHETKPVKITIKDKTGKELWKVDMTGQQGFNEYRWDLITKRQDSLLPYFTEYETYIRPGDYTLVWSDGRSELKRDIRVQTRERPHKE